jgi:peptidylprolyl isomerase
VGKVPAVIRLINFSKWPALVAACIGLAACGGSKTADIPDGSNSASSETATTATTATTSTTATKPPTFAKPTANVTKLADSISTDTKKKPKIAKPSGNPPKKLTVVDVVKGTGPAVASGDNITVDYVGNSWSDGKEFDASWDRNQTFPLTLGQGQVIQGWDQGIVGMKVGGRRMLVIPPDLGYGAQGSPPKIKGNETLVFVVDLRKKG